MTDRRPLMELLLARLPSELRTLAINRIVRFVLHTTLPSVAGETAILVDVASATSPAETTKLILEPLLSLVEAEVPSLQRAAADPSGLHLSKVTVPYPD